MQLSACKASDLVTLNKSHLREKSGYAVKLYNGIFDEMKSILSEVAGCSLSSFLL
jgi:hypothetical protein